MPEQATLPQDASSGRHRQLMFLLVGGANTVVGILLFAFFHWLLSGVVPYLVALLPTYAVGILISFTSQRLLVFRVCGNVWGDLWRFTTVQLGALALNGALLFVLVELTPLPVVIAQTVALGVVVVATYLGHSTFSFRRKDAVR